MASLILQGVGKEFPGRVKAVSDFNLEIKDKEFVILVGPSGCGKSTTLRMIAGLEEISQGKIYIDDRLVNDIPPKDRDIAMVFQSYALYPHMTVYDNIGFALKLRKLPKNEIKAKVEEVAKILGITNLLMRKPKELSGGQRQRVALGRAIVRKPKLFLFDEPLSNLDAKLRSQMRIEIIKLYQQLNTTFVYVTHDQVEAMTMGTMIVVMKDGVIQQIDNPQNLYRKPCNLFVAGFIGSPQMNFIEAVPVVKENTVYLQFGQAEIPLVGNAEKALENYLGQVIVMGIRPEDISDRPDFIDKFSHSRLETQVELAELMGAEVLLYLQYEGNNFVAKVDSDCKIKNGEKKIVAIDNHKIHLFDRDTEQAIDYSRDELI